MLSENSAVFCAFVLFRLAIVLFILFRLTYSDYPLVSFNSSCIYSLKEAFISPTGTPIPYT